MSRYRIKFFSDFCDSLECKKKYERMCETYKMENYGEDKEIYITVDDDYTHVIILNTAMPRMNTNIQKKNVIGFAQEPIFFLNITTDFLK